VELREQVGRNVSSIYDAIKQKRTVVLEGYSSANSNTLSNRLVEPFLFLNGNQEVRCFEISSKMNKTFKLSRVQDVKILDLFWQYEKYHREMLTDIFMFSSESQQLVKLRLGRLSASLLREEYPQSERYIEPDDNDHWLVELPVSSFKGIGRFVLGLMEDIDVLENDDFKDYLRQKIQTMKQRL
jgi:predicted DNA-binding transcriptional regulator YafY